MALRYGLSVAQRVGYNRLVINSDNMEVIDTMNNGGRSSSTAAAVFDDCYFLACDFPITKFEHCNREANRVAHELAKLARFSLSNLWMESAPKALIPMLVNDATILIALSFLFY